MIVAVLVHSPKHAVHDELAAWAEARRDMEGLDVHLCYSLQDLPSLGDFLFLVSWHDIVAPPVRDRFRHALLLHASDLPEGRGWSPHVWTVLEGGSRITVSLLEVADAVDTGRIWRKEVIELDGTELYDEINRAVFGAELRLMDFAIQNADAVTPVPQDSRKPTYYRRRDPTDSELDPERSLAEQFDLLRVSDPRRYPAFFRLRGNKYRLIIERMDDE